ncbi:MAG: glutamate-5-semialdehyde dehydrogenase [Clostridia bacterium]|nr:glutamate-5-semialdehyde dehydrogenase [Clostridia bacterium]
MTTQEMLEVAKAVKSSVCTLTEKERNDALLAMAKSLEDNTENILIANEMDVSKAKGKVSDVMIDRLLLNEDRIKGMAEGIRAVAKLPDPLTSEISRFTREDGLSIRKISVPMGVVAIIYESRPNVTSDAAALCFKSGNVCVLRGGKEAFASAQAIVSALKEGLKKSGVTEYAINLVTDTSRESANQLMTATGYVDLLIPRGGKGLISACVENAKVPCIQTGTGICHIYVDKYADIKKAVKIIKNAKTSRPSVCNAQEVLVVHRDIAQEFLPVIKKELQENSEHKVELRLDKEAIEIIDGTPAGEEDFDTEFLDYILAVKVTEDISKAIEHISAHSTGHSDGIITENKENAEIFVKLIDSAAVYVNASTRFTDGGEFGLGCEMGISTQKLHARGPMGLSEITTYKYVVEGNGHIR